MLISINKIPGGGHIHHPPPHTPSQLLVGSIVLLRESLNDKTLVPSLGGRGRPETEKQRSDTVFLVVPQLNVSLLYIRPLPKVNDPELRIRPCSFTRAGGGNDTRRSSEKMLEFLQRKRQRAADLQRCPGKELGFSGSRPARPGMAF
jgi:hypothetical protein